MDVKIERWTDFFAPKCIIKEKYKEMIEKEKHSLTSIGIKATNGINFENKIKNALYSLNIFLRTKLIHCGIY